jgi:hypothetical protein
MSEGLSHAGTATLLPLSCVLLEVMSFIELPDQGLVYVLGKI